MKVLVDAHLPLRLAHFLSSKNIETLKSLFKENAVIEIDQEEIQVHY